MLEKKVLYWLSAEYLSQSQIKEVTASLQISVIWGLISYKLSQNCCVLQKLNTGFRFPLLVRQLLFSPALASAWAWKSNSSKSILVLAITVETLLKLDNYKSNMNATI